MFTYNTTSKATAAALCSILNTSASQYGGQYTTSGKAVNGAADNTDTADQYAARLADAFKASKYTADAATLAASVPAPATDAVPVDTTSQPAPAPAPAPTDASQPASDGQPVADAATSDTDASQPAPAAAVMPSAADILIIAASLIKERGTLAAIKADYKALTDQYTKKGYKAILSAAAGIRYADIDTAAAGVRAAVTYDGQLLAAYDSARGAADWAKLCQYYGAPVAPATDSKADRLAAARAFVAAYYKDTDADGVITISRTAATGKDGKPLTAAAIASQFGGVSVCNADGTPTDGRRTWADWRKDVTTDAADTDTSK